MRLAPAVLLPLILLAAVPAAAADTKVGAIRTPVILRDAPQIKSADAKLKSEFEKKEKELEGEGKKLAEDIQKYERESVSMSAQQQADAKIALNTRKINFESKQRQFAEAAQNRNNELKREVLDKVNQAIEAVAKEKGYDLVLQDPAYANPAIDITDEVLKRLGATEPKKK